MKIDIPSLLVHLRARHVEAAGHRLASPEGGHHGRGVLGDGKPGALAGRASAPAGWAG